MRKVGLKHLINIPQIMELVSGGNAFQGNLNLKFTQDQKSIRITVVLEQYYSLLYVSGALQIISYLIIMSSPSDIHLMEL